MDELKDVETRSKKQNKNKNLKETNFTEYSNVKPGELVITIEFCSSCYQHESITQHSESMYKTVAEYFQKIISLRFPFIKVILKPIDIDIVKDLEYKIINPETNGKPYPDRMIINDQYKPCRIGAFEIQICDWNQEIR